MLIKIAEFKNIVKGVVLNWIYPLCTCMTENTCSTGDEADMPGTCVGRRKQAPIVIKH